ncbi:hypothetical protein PYCC9005_003036 [Savitreella phatthalungensis]
MDSLFTLSGIGTSMLLMTGTLPRSWQNDLAEKVLRDHPMPTIVFRDHKTIRKDISLNVETVQRLTSKLVSETVLRLLDRHRIKPDDRAMVICKTRHAATQLAEENSWPLIHRSVHHIQRERILAAWRQDSSRLVIVGTTALGTGLDCADIRLVVHSNAPYSLIDYAQEIGRAGRDGKGAWSYVLMPSGGFLPPEDENRDTAGLLRIQSVLQMRRLLSAVECRTAVMQDFLDGRRATCINAGRRLCDLCQSQIDENSQPVLTASQLATAPVRRVEADNAAPPVTDLTDATSVLVHPTVDLTLEPSGGRQSPKRRRETADVCSSPSPLYSNPGPSLPRYSRPSAPQRNGPGRAALDQTWPYPGTHSPTPSNTSRRTMRREYSAVRRSPGDLTALPHVHSQVPSTPNASLEFGLHTRGAGRAPATPNSATQAPGTVHSAAVSLRSTNGQTEAKLSFAQLTESERNELDYALQKTVDFLTAYNGKCAVCLAFDEDCRAENKDSCARHRRFVADKMDAAKYDHKMAVCYVCDNAMKICYLARKQQGASSCVLGDTVLPLLWGLYHRQDPHLLRALNHYFSSEEEVIAMLSSGTSFILHLRQLRFWISSLPASLATLLLWSLFVESEGSLRRATPAC